MLHVMTWAIRRVPSKVATSVTEGRDHELLLPIAEQVRYGSMDRAEQITQQVAMFFKVISASIEKCNQAEGQVVGRHDPDLCADPTFRPLEQVSQRAVHFGAADQMTIGIQDIQGLLNRIADIDLPRLAIDL